MWHQWPAGLFALLPARGMNLELIWATVGLVAAILLGVILIVWVDRWRKRSRAEGPADELDQYRGLLDQGLLSPEEYERIRTRLEQGARAKPDERIQAASQPEAPGTGGVVADKLESSTAVRSADASGPPASPPPADAGPA
jgi:hypothetical protein